MLFMKGESMSDLFCSECNHPNSATRDRVAEIYHHMAMANAPLAMGYVPTQAWETPFQPCKGLSLGTIFPSLCYPFCGKGGRCK